MTIESITKSIVSIISDELQIGEGIEIKKDSKLIEIGVDSIALMMLLVFIEEQYNFETDEDVLIGEGFDSIGDIAEYVYSKINA